MSKEDNTELEKVRKNLAQMKEEDKLLILTDLFKIKKEFEYPGTSPLEYDVVDSASCAVRFTCVSAASSSRASSARI